MAETLDEARDLVARAARQSRTRRRAKQTIRRSRSPHCAPSRPARSAPSPAFTPISSGPHFGGFREEMEHVLLLDMAIHTFDAMRCMTGLGPGRLLSRWTHKLVVSAGFFGAPLFDLEGGAVFTYRGSGARRGWHELGMRVALRRRQRLAPLGRPRIFVSRSRAPNVRPIRRSRGVPFRRSTLRQDRRPPGSDDGFVAAVEARPFQKPSAATTSRACDGAWRHSKRPSRAAG